MFIIRDLCPKHEIYMEFCTKFTIKFLRNSVDILEIYVPTNFHMISIKLRGSGGVAPSGGPGAEPPAYIQKYFLILLIKIICLTK